VNPTQASELLERAAASVTPSETDPASRMVSLGRRSVRRRRAWVAAGSVAVAVVAVVAVPLALAIPDRLDPAGPSTVSFGGLSVAVPKGWRTSRVTTFDPCIAESKTVYLAARWEPSPPSSRASSGPAADVPVVCKGDGKAWMAVVEKGVGRPTSSPERLVFKDGQLLDVEQAGVGMVSSMLSYRAFNDEMEATTAFISGDESGREQLLKRVTWPAGPSAPSSGGLMLPGKITYATSDVPPSNGMRFATDAKTLKQIRTALAELRDPVPAGEECTLQRPGAVGIGFDDNVAVMLGDTTCPQAVSSGGGRVWAPAGLGQELIDLIVASDNAASKRDKKD